MPRVADIRDTDTLRQVAQLLEYDNERQAKRIVELQQALAKARGRELTQSEIEHLYLKELLAIREAKLFGDSSEKRTHQASAVEANRERQAKQRGHGPRSQPELPIVEHPIELSPEARQCPACGGELEAMGEQGEDSEEITVIERRFVVVRHQRRKYRCRCNGCVKTAPAPLKLKRGGRYSLEFAVEVAVGKYLDHLPLQRQARIVGREGLRIDSQTLWDQLEALATLHQPTYEALWSRVFAEPLIHADESRWRLMKKGERKRWWVWGVAGSDAVVYKLLDSRSSQAGQTVLGDYRGIVMADGYEVYAKLARDGPGFKLVHCWMHARRKLLECEPHYPEVAEVLELIGELYRLEVDIVADTQAQQFAERARRRDQQARPIIEAIRQWALAQRVLPRSTLGNAIGYLMQLWPGLTAFLDDPCIPLDNGAIERGFRGVALGRKNHYGSRSQRGTEVAALMYSLMESAKLAGVEPKAYLLRATHERLRDPNAILLPHQLAQ